MNTQGHESAFGVRWQSGAATPLSGGRAVYELARAAVRAQSGVALRFPPQSKTVL